MTSSAAPLICRRAMRVDERRLVDHAPARRVEKIRGRLHAAERIGIDQLLGFRRQRAGEGNEIGLRQQCVCGNCRRRPDIRLLLADVLISGVTSISVASLSEDAYRQVKSRLDPVVNGLDSTRTLLNPVTRLGSRSWQPAQARPITSIARKLPPLFGSVGAGNPCTHHFCCRHLNLFGAS
jgi:hypothetical protein